MLEEFINNYVAREGQNAQYFDFLVDYFMNLQEDNAAGNQNQEPVKPGIEEPELTAEFFFSDNFREVTKFVANWQATKQYTNQTLH